MIKPSTKNIYSLSIGNIGIQLTSNSQFLIKGIQERYQDFPTSNSPNLEAYIELSGNLRNSPLLDTGSVFKSSFLYFTAPGYHGQIDEIKGIAHLSLSSRYPIEDADYFMRVLFALLAFQEGGILFHAAGIVHQGFRLIT
jgi:hypothetical protein